MDLNIKNTFIDATISGASDQSPLARAASDPIGKHAKTAVPLFTGPQDDAIAEVVEEDEDEDDDGDLGQVRGAPLALKSQFEADITNATEPALVKEPALPEVPDVGGWCVRNTFIDMKAHCADDEDILFRSQSAPTGQTVTGRRTSRPVDPSEPALVTPIMEDPKAEKEGINMTLQVAASRKSESNDAKLDDDDESPLVRAGTHVALDSLLSNSVDDELHRLLSGGADSPDALVGAGYPGGFPGFGMMPGYPPPYMMPGMPAMPFNPYMNPLAMQQMSMAHFSEGLGEEAALPEPGTAPPLGHRHSFHPETCNTGVVAPDYRSFCKVNFEGLLSTVTESKVHDKGVQRYLVQFSSGSMSAADGVGFVFNNRLPCPKNIQKIVSIFANAHGRINIRVYDQIIKCQASIKKLELGEWIEFVVDLDNQVATIYVWPLSLEGEPLSKAEVPYGQKLSRRKKDASKPTFDLRSGHLACVVKNTGVHVSLGS